MLLGNEINTKKIINLILDTYPNYDILLISNIGSLEMGTYKYNSDYDIAVLYISNDIPKYDKITLGNIEITFIHLHFLVDMFKSDLSCYTFVQVNEAIQLLTSTHIFDPYGICNIIKELFICSINFCPLASLYESKVNELYNFEKPESKVNIKRFLTLLYYLLYLNWIKTYSTFPPISIDALKTIILNDKQRKIISKIMEQNNCWSEELKKNKKYDHLAYKIITVSCEDQFILNDLLTSVTNKKMNKCDNLFSIDKKDIYEIVNKKKNIAIKIANFEYDVKKEINYLKRI